MGQCPCARTGQAGLRNFTVPGGKLTVCGIAGILRMPGCTEQITKEQIEALLLGVQHRGGDATGIAVMNGDELAFHKKDEIAWKYVLSQGFKDFIEGNLHEDTSCVILHTRYATV